MSRIRGRNTKPEWALRKALWREGLRYRVHPALPGRPDVAFTAKRIAIFVDGCFWHACPQHATSPATNAEFWLQKISRNVDRDQKVNALLDAAGWSVLRFWEHEVESSLDSVIARIKREIARHR